MNTNIGRRYWVEDGMVFWSRKTLLEYRANK